MSCSSRFPRVLADSMKELDVVLEYVRQIENPKTRRLGAKCVSELALILNGIMALEPEVSRNNGSNDVPAYNLRVGLRETKKESGKHG